MFEVAGAVLDTPDVVIVVCSVGVVKLADGVGVFSVAQPAKRTVAVTNVRAMRFFLENMDGVFKF